MGYSEKYIIIEEEIEIGSGQPPIESLLRYDACAVIDDNKLINGKCVVKGEVSFNALYSTTEGMLQTLKNSIPFSQLIELEGVNENCECDTKVEVVYLEIKPKVSSNGDVRVLCLNAKLLIKAEAYCNNDIEVVIDAFSRKFETKINKTNVAINKLYKNISEIFNCKKNIEFKDNINSISDLWCDIQNSNYRFDGQHLIVSGVVCIGMIALCDEVPTYYEKNIDFEYKYTLKDYFVGEPTCDLQLEILSLNYTITGNGTIEIRLELSVNAAIYIINEISLINQLQIDEKNHLEKKSNCSLIIYCANKDENLWDIARHYSASIKEIKNLNNLKEDTIQNEKMLLVPIN